MTLSISNEIPENVRRGLIAKGEGATWEECAEIAKFSRYELQQWRQHPDADNLISTSINYHLEEALGTIAAAAPTLTKRLVEIGLDRSTRPYAAIQAIDESFKIISNNISDKENRDELKEIKHALDKLEDGNTYDIFAESSEQN